MKVSRSLSILIALVVLLTLMVTPAGAQPLKSDPPSRTISGVVYLTGTTTPIQGEGYRLYVHCDGGLKYYPSSWTYTGSSGTWSVVYYPLFDYGCDDGIDYVGVEFGAPTGYAANSVSGGQYCFGASNADLRCSFNYSSSGSIAYVDPFSTISGYALHVANGSPLENVGYRGYVHCSSGTESYVGDIHYTGSNGYWAETFQDNSNYGCSTVDYAGVEFTPPSGYSYTYPITTNNHCYGSTTTDMHCSRPGSWDQNVIYFSDYPPVWPPITVWFHVLHPPLSTTTFKLEWSVGTHDPTASSDWHIDRRVDGGSWVEDYIVTTFGGQSGVSIYSVMDPNSVDETHLYEYRLQSHNHTYYTWGTEVYASARPVPAKPTNFSVSKGSVGVFNFSWTNNSSTVDYYELWEATPTWTEVLTTTSMSSAQVTGIPNDGATHRYFLSAYRISDGWRRYTDNTPSIIATWP